MQLTKVNVEQCVQIGHYLKNLKKDPSSYTTFGGVEGDDQNPPLSLGVERVSNYYCSVISIDCRFWQLGPNKEIKPDYDIINKKQEKGATYLWKKSMQMVRKNPNFFEAENLATLSDQLYEEWLADETGKIPLYDPDRIRLKIARNCGEVLLKKYNGSANQIWEASGHKLLNNGNGFLELCDEFYGYRDPRIYKKANLVVKFMERRGLWKAEDPENKSPPIDYHLMRTAIRTGMVEIISKQLQRKIKERTFLTPEEEFVIRLSCKHAFGIIATAAGIDSYLFDDDFWFEGRKSCQQEPPKCEGALLASVCLANTSNPELKEYSQPLVDTWKY